MGLTVVSVRDVRWAGAAHAAVEMVVRFAELGQEVPFTACPDDVEAHGRELFEQAVGGAFGVIAEPDPVDPAAARDEALRLVDAQTDELYAAVIGNRGEEYRQAEADALAYQAAGFTGQVPGSVAVWATASGMTPQAAAQDVLAQAAAWRTALLAIRQARLTSKAGVRAGTVSESMAAWAAFVAGIRLQLGV